MYFEGPVKPEAELLWERQPLRFCSKGGSPRGQIQISRLVRKGTCTIVMLTRFLSREKPIGPPAAAKPYIFWLGRVFAISNKQVNAMFQRNEEVL